VKNEDGMPMHPTSELLTFLAFLTDPL